HRYPLSLQQKSRVLLNHAPFPLRPVSFQGKTFEFLNRPVSFEHSIDWNYSLEGKLWTYNLNYFDYLLQPGMTSDQGLVLIRDFIRKMDRCTDGLEPYPISLRSINWIKFLCIHRIQD